MKSQRFLAFAMAAGLLIAMPHLVLAQGGGAGSGSGAGGGGQGGGGSGLGGGGSGSSGGLATGANIASVSTGIGKAATSGAGSATSIPSDKNPFASTYVDYLSLGKSTNYSLTGSPAEYKGAGSFGKGIYTTTTTTSSSTGGSTSTKQAHGFNSLVPRSPTYSTVLSDTVPLVVRGTPELQNSVQAVLRNRANVNFTVTGTTVELTGQVSSDRERRTIEGMVRMTPGVRNVQNALQVALPK
jgi:hypothetical protein